MSGSDTTRLLASLVHQGTIDPDTARAALASGDPQKFLIDRGVADQDQWAEWVRTEAGFRPELSRYEVSDLLGEGGTARVFRALDRKTGETLALKVLKPALSKDPTCQNRFVREARLLMEIECEHIVRGVRVAREGDQFFFAMELIEGECLQDTLDDGRLDETLALQVVVQIARALTYLHGRGLVHRDVKPGNILLTSQGRAVLIDLGFAIAGSQESDTTAGTVHYIAPEQARGQTDLDVRADIYSLGATLYHLVTGALPFAGTTSEEVMAKQVLEALSGEKIRAMGLSPQTHYFIEKMMAKEKEIRFQSPDQLALEIETWLQQKSEDVPRPRPRRKRRKWL